jgi:hypothetical protein
MAARQRCGRRQYGCGTCAMHLAKTVRGVQVRESTGVGVRVAAPCRIGAVPRVYPERYRTAAAPAPNRDRVSNEPKAQVLSVFGLANRALEQPV